MDEPFGYVKNCLGPTLESGRSLWVRPLRICRCWSLLLVPASILEGVEAEIPSKLHSAIGHVVGRRASNILLGGVGGWCDGISIWCLQGPLGLSLKK